MLLAAMPSTRACIRSRQPTSSVMHHMRGAAQPTLSVHGAADVALTADMTQLLAIPNTMANGSVLLAEHIVGHDGAGNGVLQRHACHAPGLLHGVKAEQNNCATEGNMSDK